MKPVKREVNCGAREKKRDFKILVLLVLMAYNIYKNYMH